MLCNKLQILNAQEHNEQKYLFKVGVAPYGLGAREVEDANDKDDDDEDLASRHTCHPDHCLIPSPALRGMPGTWSHPWRPLYLETSSVLL